MTFLSWEQIRARLEARPDDLTSRVLLTIVVRVEEIREREDPPHIDELYGDLHDALLDQIGAYAEGEEF